MEIFFSTNSSILLVIALLSGFVKGVSGFAMPLIMFSGFLLFFPQDTAIALIIIPSLISNLFQIFGLNLVEIRRFFFDYSLLIVSCFVMVFSTSQLFIHFSKIFIYGALFIMIFCFLYATAGQLQKIGLVVFMECKLD